MSGNLCAVEEMGSVTLECHRYGCRGLINLVKSTSSQSTVHAAVHVGTALFYAVTTYVSEDTKFYPPARQFFSCCIEILGQVRRRWPSDL